MKITLHLEKTFTIDLEKDSDTKAAIINALSENENDDSETEVVLDANSVKTLIEENVEDFFDLSDIDLSDFTITVSE